MEVPRLVAESELQLPAYTTATAMQDPSCDLNLHLSSRQHRILNPMTEARDRTCVLMDILVSFLVTVEQQSELRSHLFFFFLKNKYKVTTVRCWG